MLKDNIIYNKFDNKIMARTNKNKIYIMCKGEDQAQGVINRMTSDCCYLSNYEDDDDIILTFDVATDGAFQLDIN